MPTGYRLAQGLRIRYAESAPEGERVVLLTSPWPESLMCYASIWARLAQHARLVAIDLPGFGQSERRLDLYRPRAMAEFLAALIDEWGLVCPHLLAPDIGTAAALYLAAGHREIVTSLIVGSGAACVPLHVTGALKELIEAQNVVGLRGVDPATLVMQALEGMDVELLAAVLDDYVASYAGDRFVESTRYVRSYPVELPPLMTLLPTITTPVQIVSGEGDDIVPPANGLFLAGRIPNSRHARLSSGHFTWEDASDEFVAIVIRWIRGGYLASTED
jgi:pimeloyl-ACP methyl ester carboxylesterase